MEDKRIEDLKRNLVEELKYQLSVYYNKDTFCQEDLEDEDFWEWFQEETYGDDAIQDFYNETGIELMVCDYVFNEKGEIEVIVQEP